MIGKGQHLALVSLMERKSRLILLAKVEGKKTEMLATSVISLLKPLRLSLHTLASGNTKDWPIRDYCPSPLWFVSSLCISMPLGNSWSM